MTTTIGLPSRSQDMTEYDVGIFNETIHTTVTANPNIVTSWINGVLNRSNLPGRIIVGFDAQTRPFCSPAHVFPIGTLGLYVDRHCLVFQISRCPELPQSLIDFLSNQNHVFVGVGITANYEKLFRDYFIGWDMSYVELGTLAADCYNWKPLRNASLIELSYLVLSKAYYEPLNIGNLWDAAELSPMQVLYATIGHFVSSEVGRRLRADLVQFE